MLTSVLSCQMIAYFDKCQTILLLTQGIPAFLALDQFLGYSSFPNLSWTNQENHL